MTFPNWRPALRDTQRNDRQFADKQKAYKAGSLEPNRAERRAFVRANQPRTNRLHLIGLGRWRRHNPRDYDSVAKQTAIVQIAPRRERRPAMIERAKVGRQLRRQQLRGQR